MDQKRLQAGLLAGLSDTRLMRAINAMHKRPARDLTGRLLKSLSG